MNSKSAKFYARMICDYLKELPDKYADDPRSVQMVLGLTDDEFKMGLDFCVAKKVIVLDKPAAAPAKPSPFTASAAPAPTAKVNPFGGDTSAAKPSPFTTDKRKSITSEQMAVRS